MGLRSDDAAAKGRDLRAGSDPEAVRAHLGFAAPGHCFGRVGEGVTPVAPADTEARLV